MSTSGRTASSGVLGGVSAWTLHLTVLGVLILALGALYWSAVTAAVRVWWVSPTYSHCYLIIPVSAYLIWGKRRILAQMSPAAFPKALLLALPVAAFSFVGALTSINEVEQLSFVAFAQVMALSVLGPRVYRVILFPALYLFFLVPMGEYLIPPLQMFTTHFIDVGLSLIGILHYTEGSLIELANGAFRVAEACAGLRFLIATIAVGVLFSYFTYRKWYKTALFLIACVIVPVIGNGFRALGIVLLAHYSDNKIAVGADHLIYGWGFSVAILAVLMLVGMRFADDFKEDDEPPPETGPRPPARALPLTILAALAVIVLVPSFQYVRAETIPAVDTAAFAAPPSLPGWSVEKVSSAWHPVYAPPDAGMSFAMQPADPFTPSIDVFVDYYGAGNRHNNLITSTNKMWEEDVWHKVSGGDAAASLGNQPVRFKELRIASGGVERLIWWTYASGGRFTTSGMDVKLDRVKTVLLGGGGAALLAVSTRINGDVGNARLRLRSALKALGGIRGRLEHPPLER